MPWLIPRRFPAVPSASRWLQMEAQFPWLSKTNLRPRSWRLELGGWALELSGPRIWLMFWRIGIPSQTRKPSPNSWASKEMSWLVCALEHVGGRADSQASDGEWWGHNQATLRNTSAKSWGNNPIILHVPGYAWVIYIYIYIHIHNHIGTKTLYTVITSNHPANRLSLSLPWCGFEWVGCIIRDIPENNVSICLWLETYPLVMNVWQRLVGCLRLDSSWF